MRAFQTIDSRMEGFLDFSNIMNFCRRNNFYASESDIIAIVMLLIKAVFLIYYSLLHGIYIDGI